MTITPVVRISDGKLIVKGQTILSGVPDNVISSSASSSGPSEGIFLGALFNENKSKHVVPLGTLSEVRFLSIFRFKLWWMAQRMGNQGKEIPLETQFLLFESNSVTQEGVEDGLKSLSDGGVSPKFVIIDDGWQSVGPDPVECRKDPTLEPINRITGIKENDKFKDKEIKTVGIEHIVKIAKEKYGLKYVYVWHAITGYWGGVHTNVEGYNSSLTYPNASDEMILNDPTWKIDPMLLQGLGLVNPKKAYKFYNEMHEYLASSGVDGVKVDVQAILETLGGGIGGRIQLARQYHQALDASVAKNFPGNGIIACMSHNADSLYCSKQTAVVRASDDFYPRDPVSHTIHIASVSFNSVFLGEFMVPDWDMFHSQHPSAEYHASARAISGGPVYVSLLKIWNMNKYTGVLGVYNCQGAAWSDIEKKNAFHETETEILTGAVKGSDVHLISEAAIDSKWNAELVTLSKVTSIIPISLKILEHEIFTVTPIKEMGEEVRFAPIGLIDMYNAGGAIAGLIYEEKCGQGVGRVMMEVKGCGRLGAYSSVKPSKFVVGSESVGFDYDFSSGLLSLNLNQLPGGGGGGGGG
ncbi:galactinol--sucrose galactosyltransferase [Ranunculus cassubicifolius]